jgi:predicted GIY-YIG superfamily endonuclease
MRKMGCMASIPAVATPNFKVYVCRTSEAIEPHFYVGVTSKPLLERLGDHMSGNGTRWTSLYPPSSIEFHKGFATRREANVEETAHTLELMMQYGIKYVRGGKYASPIFSQHQRVALRHDIAHNYSLCYKCMEPHLSKYCTSYVDLEFE